MNRDYGKGASTAGTAPRFYGKSKTMADGGLTEEELNRGLGRQSRSDDTGLWDRIKAGNIDERGSQASMRWGQDHKELMSPTEPPSSASTEASAPAPAPEPTPAPAPKEASSDEVLAAKAEGERASKPKVKAKPKAKPVEDKVAAAFSDSSRAKDVLPAASAPADTKSDEPRGMYARGIAADKARFNKWRDENLKEVEMAKPNSTTNARGYGSTGKNARGYADGGATEEKGFLGKMVDRAMKSDAEKSVDRMIKYGEDVHLKSPSSAPASSRSSSPTLTESAGRGRDTGATERRLKEAGEYADGGSVGTKYWKLSGHPPTHKSGGKARAKRYEDGGSIEDQVAAQAPAAEYDAPAIQSENDAALKSAGASAEPSLATKMRNRAALMDSGSGKGGFAGGFASGMGAGAKVGQGGGGDAAAAGLLSKLADGGPVCSNRDYGKGR